LAERNIARFWQHCQQQLQHRGSIYWVLCIVFFCFFFVNNMPVFMSSFHACPIVRRWRHYDLGCLSVCASQESLLAHYFINCLGEFPQMCNLMLCGQIWTDSIWGHKVKGQDPDQTRHGLKGQRSTHCWFFLFSPIVDVYHSSLSVNNEL